MIIFGVSLVMCIFLNGYWVSSVVVILVFRLIIRVFLSFGLSSIGMWVNDV